MGAFYRVRQFFHTLIAKPEASQLEKVDRVLESPLAALFMRMSPPDQLHSLRVLDTLQREGQSDPDLLAAALLHDVGKSVYPLSILDRVIIVLANRFLPGRVIRWGRSEPRGWRRSFVIATQHPHWGAELAAQHGASPRLVALIRHHQDKTPLRNDSGQDALLQHLQRVDSQN